MVSSTSLHTYRNLVATLGDNEDIVYRCLLDDFPSGATARQILECLRPIYPDIFKERVNVSPRLTKLKEKGLVIVKSKVLCPVGNNHVDFFQVVGYRDFKVNTVGFLSDTEFKNLKKKTLGLNDYQKAELLGLLAFDGNIVDDLGIGDGASWFGVESGRSGHNYGVGLLYKCTCKSHSLKPKETSGKPCRIVISAMIKEIQDYLTKK